MLYNKYRKRCINFFWIIVCLFIVVLCRLCYLQLWQGKEIGEKSRSKRTITLESRRGIIYDRQGRELAVSIGVNSLYAHPKLVKDFYRTALKLSPILGMPTETILRQLRKNAPFVWIKRKISARESSQIKKLKLDGCNFIKEQKRFYPKKSFASNLIGFVNLDDKGSEGIELQFDHCLRGPTKKIPLIKDAKGRFILEDKEDTSPKSGYDLILTIDEVIQHAAEIELKNACEQHQASAGSIIIMNPKTGEILALAIQPTYNPNSFREYSSSFWRNRVIADSFEPGSTFKIITAANLLEKKLVTPDDNFNCTGGIAVQNRYIRCHKTHGEINFRSVVADSCNVGIITASRKLDFKSFYSFILDLGFHQLTRVDLPGEELGIASSPKSILVKSTMSIGQGISVTPIQLITAVSAIANGGMLMKPLVIKAIRSPEGKIIKEYHPVEVKQVLQSQTCRDVTELLKGVVTQGSGELTRIEGYAIAGKTGTAQKVDSATGRYSPTKFVSSFIGYLPADDPQIIALVIIDEPKGISWGSKVAVPTFAKVIKRILPYLDILPEKVIVPATTSTEVFN